jgi:hypothetical protein
VSVPPNKSMVDLIVKTLDTNILPLTLGELYRGSRGYAWNEFLTAIDYMIDQGFLLGKGDGFVVHYALTQKGREQLGSLHTPSSPKTMDGFKDGGQAGSAPDSDA